ncbi:uncharacterized protein LOC123318346 [Coccinella septempunctata]|uniref:uncharacterized protein LOC123318346 n=1 Tax=Coccinella septempunctata TaxID=41139 RepID=UPI001D081499|nr:uncharacterized protein LOC123318346 [Coccinella septempunctata]
MVAASKGSYLFGLLCLRVAGRDAAGTGGLVGPFFSTSSLVILSVTSERPLAFSTSSIQPSHLSWSSVIPRALTREAAVSRALSGATGWTADGGEPEVSVEEAAAVAGVTRTGLLGLVDTGLLSLAATPFESGSCCAGLLASDEEDVGPWGGSEACPRIWLGACSTTVAGWPGIAVPPGSAHFKQRIIYDQRSE